MTHRYFAAPGAGFSDEDAAVLGERISVLSAQGNLTPERVVDDARPEDSPTHRFFEWNDAVAAERYRIGQARHYLTNIYVVRRESREAIRADQLLRITPARQRRPATTHIETAQNLVDQAKEDLARWHQRYESCRELRPAAILVREALKTLETLAKRRLSRVG